MAEPPAPPPGDAAQPPLPPPQAKVAPPKGKAAKPAEPPWKTQTSSVQPRQPERSLCIAAVSVVCVILTGLMLAIVWLPILPKRLDYSVERASVTRLNLSSDDRLTADLRFLVRASNPSGAAGATFYYEKINATASYGKLDLASAANSIPPFHQPPGNSTEMELNLTATDLKVANETVASDLRAARGRGELGLWLKIMATMRLKIGALKVIHRTLNVACGPMKVPFASSSSSTGFQRVVCHEHTGD